MMGLLRHLLGRHPNGACPVSTDYAPDVKAKFKEVREATHELTNKATAHHQIVRSRSLALAEAALSITRGEEQDA